MQGKRHNQTNKLCEMDGKKGRQTFDEHGNQRTLKNMEPKTLTGNVPFLLDRLLISTASRTVFYSIKSDSMLPSKQISVAFAKQF